MLLKDLSTKSVRVAVIPSAPDKILVERKGGGFTAVSIDRFVGAMVDAIREEVKING